MRGTTDILAVSLVTQNHLLRLSQSVFLRPAMSAGLLTELSPELSAWAKEMVDRENITLEKVQESLARAGGKSLSEIVLEQRGPKG